MASSLCHSLVRYTFVQLFSHAKPQSKIRLLWITGIVGFILSAVIDNLTATIVLISLLRKLIHNREERIWYASLIVIATNAGGAWSPIGDVTTTMLWIANKVTATGLMEYVIVPSILCFAIPFFIALYFYLQYWKKSTKKKIGDERLVNQ